MPTYDYLCDACEHRFELFQSIKDSAQKKCPKCKKLKLRRLIGAGAAIVFKGSGFYQTDYRSESYKKQAKADSGAAADSGSTGSKSNTGGDAKADTSKGDSSKTGNSKKSE